MIIDLREWTGTCIILDDSGRCGWKTTNAGTFGSSYMVVKALLNDIGLQQFSSKIFKLPYGVLARVENHWLTPTAIHAVLVVRRPG